MIVELHLLQSVPVSPLPREALEQPQATFGNVPRGSLSSRFLRDSAGGLLPARGLGVSSEGVSTRRLVGDAGRWIDAAACVDEPSEDTADVVREAFYELGLGLSARELTPSVVFTAPRADEGLARFCLDGWDDFADRADRRKKIIANAAGFEEARAEELKLPGARSREEQRAAAERVLAPRQAVDVALFGGEDFSARAASEVAPAVSTHECAPPAEADAALVALDPACYYRYARLDLERLAHNLGGDAELVSRAAEAWLGCLVHALPGAAASSTAARTVPELVLSVVREHGSWNLINAFIDPVSGAGVLSRSADRLVEYFGQVRSFYGTDEIRTVLGAAVAGDLPGDAFQRATTFEDLTTRTLAAAL
ncbi:type I-E CRISPR-associated protein Cas7/Cse4/CasC [Saccharopolyspora sp. MS10]|uniref:type I-E CRISPR-associated protein Cas7/Cse4/CasC n=1 Tax=Saccharopolyspora sp. MS10 TaxID=3385973 RepID=UPI0039A281A6